MGNRTTSLRMRLFWAFTLVTVIAVTLPVYFFRNTLYQDRIDAAGSEALAHAFFARSILDADPTEEQLNRLFAVATQLSFRMTLTDTNGMVLRDSHVGEKDIPELDNHSYRPEIATARAKGTGISLRHGNTLDLDAVYAAITLDNGGILRVAVPLVGIRQSLERQFPALLGSIAGVGLFCLFLSAVITRKIRKHMDNVTEIVGAISRETGLSQRRLRTVQWSEMLPLAYAVNHMADTIQTYVAETTDQQGQLETILDSMHEGVLVLGPTGAIRRWNRALARLFPDIARTKGASVIEAIPFPALQDRVDAILSRESSTATPLPLPEDPLHFEMPAGRFLVAYVTHPARRNDSLGAVIVVYDSTEITRLEQVRRDFVSNVSHELRTPLTAIAGYSETLASAGDLNADYQKFAAIIHKHAVSLAEIISDLLALARIENTRKPVALDVMDAKIAALDAIGAVRDQTKAKDIRVHMDFTPDLVRANANLLTQVFRNLLENACRYSPQSGEIRISSCRKGRDIVFCVCDNGPGIPATALPRIFERFYQMKKERNSGTAGIGLAICKHIIERHGGRIWAESPYRDSSTAMLFTLPAALTEEVRTI